MTVTVTIVKKGNLSAEAVVLVTLSELIECLGG